MVRFTLILVSFIAFNLFSVISFAQDTLKREKMKNYLYFQPNFGASQYFGDLNEDDYLNRDPQFAFGAVLGYQLSHLVPDTAKAQHKLIYGTMKSYAYLQPSIWISQDFGHLY